CSRASAPPDLHPFPTRRSSDLQVERQPDGELRFRRPDGRPLPESPALPAVPGDPVGMLRARHDECGLNIDARTAMPGWLGERLRSEEHTSELQSPYDLVCRLLL